MHSSSVTHNLPQLNLYSWKFLCLKPFSVHFDPLGAHTYAKGTLVFSIRIVCTSDIICVCCVPQTTKPGTKAATVLDTKTATVLDTKAATVLESQDKEPQITVRIKWV